MEYCDCITDWAWGVGGDKEFLGMAEWLPCSVLFGLVFYFFQKLFIGLIFCNGNYLWWFCSSWLLGVAVSESVLKSRKKGALMRDLKKGSNFT